jgi:hypothetical protein
MTQVPRRRRVEVVLSAVVVLLCAVLLRPARADNVTRLINDLSSSDDYKVRLSAVASLAKLGDQRAIGPLVDALAGDDESAVRVAAAVALGKLVNGNSDEDDIDAANDALSRASKKDKNSSVKAQAKKALAKIKKAVDSGSGGSGGGGGGIYVNLGPMSAKISDDADTMRDLMKKTVDHTFSKNAPDMKTKWGSSASPSEKDLKGAFAFYVDGTLNTLTTKAKGSDTIVTCKISMLIATYPKKSIFGLLDGGASVQASNDPSDIEGAKSDCVSAVVEDLTIKKIIPTIKAKAQ